MDQPVYDLKVSNIVAILDLHKKIDLINLSAVKPEINYDPEIFPAARYKVAKDDVEKNKRYYSFNIFSSGKIGIAGCSSEAELQVQAKYITEYLGAIIK